MFIEITGLSKRFGAVAAVDGVSFSVAEGAFLALLGPSGSGKTTVLRMLSGLETPDSGRISINGRVVYQNGTSVAPEARDIGMVFQDYALWPHMTVGQNVAFGLRLRKLKRESIAAQVAASLAMVHLDGMAERYPDQLSGGQQQRVAIARAIATRPRLLLLDEPLSNLDALLREEMRVELVRLLKAQSITAVYVTHDRIEALAMADQIAVLRDGRMVQMGTPEELYSHPSNAFIAGFLGAANFVAGSVEKETGGYARVDTGQLQVCGMAPHELDRRGVAVLRPEDGTLHAQQPVDPGNTFAGEVVHSEFLGGRWRHVVALAGNLTMQLLTPMRAPAKSVWVHFPLDRCLVLPE